MIYQAVYLMTAILFVAGARTHEEPQCSKYHFEEKVLEKLVRMEHNMEVKSKQLDIWDEKMEAQISKMNNEEAARMDKIEKHISKINDAEVTLTNKVDTLQDTIQQQLDGQKLKLGEVLSNFQQQVGRLSQDLMDQQGEVNKTLLAFIKTHETAVNKMKDELTMTTPTVVFTGRTVSNLKPTAGSLMVYTETVTNVGGGYNTGTGYLTTPHAGTYLFALQICTSDYAWLRFQIIAADVVIGTVNNYEHGAHTCTSGTGVAILSPGDKVWVKCIYRNSISYSLHEDDENWNSFSGVLIHTNTK